MTHTFPVTMKPTISTWLVLNLLWFLSAPTVVQAQLLLDGPVPTPNRVALSLGLEPELTASLQYEHRWQAAQKTAFRLGAVLTAPPYRVRDGSARLSLLTAADWQSAGRWQTTLALLPYYARNQNRAGTLDGYGLEVRLLPTHRGRHWRSGFDLGWQSTLLTHVRHAEAARATFQDRYPAGTTGGTDGPANGWYRLTAQRFRLGFLGAGRVSERVGWQVSIGSQFVLQRQGVGLSFAHGQVPVYAETGISLGW